MVAQFLIVPQWQGSPSSRAMRLADGALAIAADLPAGLTTHIEIPEGAGSDMGTGVHRLSTIVDIHSAIHEVLHRVNELLTPIIIGGDCSVTVTGVQHLVSSHPSPHRRVAVLWFDAHGDLHTPETSESHAFSGMALSSLIGHLPEWMGGITQTQPIVLAGARALDDAEAVLLAESDIEFVSAEAVSAASVSEALARITPAEVEIDGLYIHIDLDVLDPSTFSAVSDAQPFGVSLSQLLESIVAARRLLPLKGATIAGFAPESPEQAGDDMGTILRIIGALTRDLDLS